MDVVDDNDTHPNCDKESILPLLAEVEWRRKSVWIRLNAAGRSLAQQVTESRNRRNKKTPDSHGAENRPRREHLHGDGAQAEVVILGFQRAPLGQWQAYVDTDHPSTLPKYDVGRIGVRSTIYSSGGCTAHRSDPNELELALVRIHSSGWYELPGHISAEIVKSEPYWNKNLPKPCYLYPGNKMIPWVQEDIASSKWLR